MRLERIVVGVDFDEPSVAAARWTARHFAPDAELVLVHAVFGPEPPRILRGVLPRADTMVEDARRGAEARLRDVADGLAGPIGARRAAYEVRVGPPAEQLLDCARERGAALAVVGRHGGHGGPRDWLGSTAESILRASVVPVLLVAGARDAPPQRILVALDDDAVMPSVLQWARELRARFAAHVVALHVLRSVPAMTDLAMAQVGAGGITIDPALVERELEAESQRWREHVAQAGLATDDVRIESALGDAGHEIVEAAARDGCDLIVLGNRRGQPGRTMLGTAVRHVLRHAPCPVLAVTMPLDEIAEEAERRVGDARDGDERVGDARDDEAPGLVA